MWEAVETPPASLDQGAGRVAAAPAGSWLPREFEQERGLMIIIAASRAAAWPGVGPSATYMLLLVSTTLNSGLHPSLTDEETAEREVQ